VSNSLVLRVNDWIRSSRTSREVGAEVPDWRVIGRRSSAWCQRRAFSQEEDARGQLGTAVLLKEMTAPYAGVWLAGRARDVLDQGPVRSSDDPGLVARSS
jgi:hypothetical protein